MPLDPSWVQVWIALGGFMVASIANVLLIRYTATTILNQLKEFKIVLDKATDQIITILTTHQLHSQTLHLLEDRTKFLEDRHREPIHWLNGFRMEWPEVEKNITKLNRSVDNHQDRLVRLEEQMSRVEKD